MGQSIEDRAANGDGSEQDELFPAGSVDGDGVTLAKLRKPGQSVEATVSLSSAEVPSGGGLVDPEREGRLLVTYEPGKVEEVPVREEGRVVSWKERQHLRVVHVERVARGGDHIEASFVELLDGDPKTAGKLLDRLQKRAKAALAPA